MMKRTFGIVLTALLLIPCVALGTSLRDDALRYAKSCLTEVYGYTAEDADAFTFEVQQSDDGVTVTYFNHPGWEYRVTRSADGNLSASTPFVTVPLYDAYPGESSVRQGLYVARENGWFTRWDDESVRSGMAAWLKQWGITPTPALADGMANGSLTAAQALSEYFLSCYGPESDWPAALSEWYQQELDSYDFSPEPVSEAFSGVRTYAIGDTQVTEFSGETPQELSASLAHPRLSGWTLQSGACIKQKSGAASGLAIFGRGEERMLCSLWLEAGAESWTVLPVGDGALLSGREVTVRYGGSHAFELCYPISEKESERFSVTPELLYASGDIALRYCRLNSYVYENDATGAFMQIDAETESGSSLYQWFRMNSRAYEGGSYTMTRTPVLLPLYLDFWDIDAFPRTEAAFHEAQGDALPEGYGVIAGVRLRRETSTHSEILGDYFSGVPVMVLEELPGDPDPWYRVRIGSVEGYMSSRYVDFPGSPCTMYPLQSNVTLPPVAACAQDTALKAGTGWFDRTVQELPSGTRLRVLAEQGDWLHVAVADGPMGWLALTDGLADGYVRAADVLIAATEAQLDWLE